MQNIQQYRRQASCSLAPTDPRWAAFDIVRKARKALGLKDRSIAVLRGLLSLIPTQDWNRSPFVHASNTTLQERCDGIDERTLRRHLGRLESIGLIYRQQSPNRKRYTVRDETGFIVLSYGFDVSPLRDALPRLQALAEQEAYTAAQIQARKALLRDRLYQTIQRHPEREQDLLSLYRLLRRNTSVEALEDAISKLDDFTSAQRLQSCEHESTNLSDSDGQIDRDIHSSNKESIELEQTAPATKPNHHKSAPVSLGECLARASTAMEFALTPPKTWSDLCNLANQLGPSLGIRESMLQDARSVLGEQGHTLAVLGLTQAYPQIRQPAVYLHSLLKKAQNGALNVHRMFRSLTAAHRHRQFPAGNHA
ncbi:hypothetical protein HOY34_07895 [Xinfangfangia sp. D13-10-4-6]|uniref:plasmid replication protein RepC n=1 Tax=Pseudogemmobacter hezensis TaxID=2737662 RepID=UPI0015536367|nr:plasmid replication protein RepC [Pseudogemmobacter hezensis]NPD15122.1 hypothetical protein [Pseudogemmobacter hezensis]